MAAGPGLTVRKLVTSWGYQVDDSALKKMDKSIASMKTTLKYTLGLATAVGGAMLAIVKTTADSASEASRASQKVGLTADQYQRLAAAAKMSKLESEELQMGLIRLNRTAYNAATQGGQTAQTFAQLGIPIRDANGKLRSTNDILLDVSDKFHNMPNGMRKTALAMELMGRGGATMIPFLNKGREKIKELGDEAKKLGLVLSDDTIAQGKEFNRNMKLITETIIGLKNQIGTALLPVAIQWITALREWLVQNQQLIKSRIEFVLKLVANNLGIILGFMTAIVALQMVKVFVDGASAALKLASALNKVGLAKAFAQGGLPFLVAAGVAGLGYMAGRSMGYFGGKSDDNLSAGKTEMPVRSTNRGVPWQIVDKRQIHVVAPVGADAHAFGETVARVSTPGLDKMLRQAHRDFAMPGAI